MKDRRKLIGRRFEDFERHHIPLTLTVYERFWYKLITSSRYQSLLDRRRSPRRREDAEAPALNEIFYPATSVLFFSDDDIGSPGSENRE